MTWSPLRISLIVNLYPNMVVFTAKVMQIRSQGMVHAACPDCSVCPLAWHTAMSCHGQYDCASMRRSIAVDYNNLPKQGMWGI